MSALEAGTLELEASGAAATEAAASVEAAVGATVRRLETLADAEQRALRLWYGGSRGMRRAWATLRAAVLRSKAIDALTARAAASARADVIATAHLCLVCWRAHAASAAGARRCFASHQVGFCRCLKIGVAWLEKGFAQCAKFM